MFVEDLCLFEGFAILAGELVFKPEGLAVEVGKLQDMSKGWVLRVFSVRVGRLGPVCESSWFDSER